MLKVRPPEPSESGSISELVIQSDCGMLPALFGATLKRLISRLQAAPSNPYSSDNTLVIVDETGIPAVIGALVGALASATRAANPRTAALLFGWYGPGVFFRLPALARAGKALADLERDDFYLSHIAILPEHRGRGAGKKLLLAGEENAGAAGARRMVLDVEERNEEARSFYACLGYRFASSLCVDLGRRGPFSFFRLVKDL